MLVLELAAAIQSGQEPLFRAEFDLCPSLSGAYNNNPRAGRIKTAEYKKWEKVAVWEARAAAKHLLIDYPVAAVYTLTDCCKGDAANYEKCASDMLKKACVLKDDRFIRCNVQQFGDLLKKRMRMEIYKINYGVSK